MIKIELDAAVNEYTSLGVRETIKNNDDKDIELGISSLGGSLDEGLKMYYSLIEHKGDSTAIFKGRSASAATILAMGAKKREIYQNSHILIHKVLKPTFLMKLINSDNIDDLIKELKNDKKRLDSLDLSLANIYYQKAKKKGKSEKDILNLMSKDTWLNANAALEWGFVDSIRNEDFAINEDNQNALLNMYNLPAIENSMTETIENTIDKTEDMNFFDKFKNSLTTSLKIGEEEANAKANEFIASFNNDLKNEVLNAGNDLAQKLEAKEQELTELKNSIQSLQNEIKDLPKPQPIEVENFVSVDKFNELQNSLIELKNQIDANGKANLKNTGVDNDADNGSAPILNNGQKAVNQFKSWLSNAANQ